MKYNDIPADIRALQDKIDAIHSREMQINRDLGLINYNDPYSYSPGSKVWIGRYTAAQFKLIDKYELDPMAVLFALANKDL